MIISIALCVGLFFGPCSALAADTPTLYGMQFPVDEVTAIDSKTVKVTIGAESEIISRESLDDYAARKLLSNPTRARRLPRVAVERFFKAANEAGDKKRLLLALQGLCSHSFSDQAAVADFLSSQSQTEMLREVFKEVLAAPKEYAIPEMLVPRLFVAVGIEDPSWAGGQAPALSNAQLSWIRETLRDQLMAALRARNFKVADRLLLLQQQVLGDKDTDYRTLRVFASRLEAAVAALARDDVEPAFALAAVSKANPELYPIAVELTVQASHQSAKSELERGDGGAALAVLVRMDFERRTPQTHELILQSLSALRSPIGAVIEDARIGGYLQKVCGVDERVRGSYLGLLESEARQKMQQEQIEASVDLIRRIVDVRQDPDATNDSLRFELARAYLKSGGREQAKQVVAEIQTGVGAWRYITLTWDGYFVTARYVLIVFLGAFAFVVVRLGVAGLTRRRDEQPLETPRKRPAYSVGEGEQPEEEEREEDKPSGFSIVSAKLFTPAMQEYHRSLEGLGLKPGASLAEIKKQYRNLVKKVHPDLNQNLSAEDQDRFVALTKMYDRILELRSQLGISEP